ncbi:hypothetical protein CHLNCDRAFT_135921 [Chlorella variabilis]|uniref:Uncharacterized protein n=1 Tax=Chlorella variabilis TaxID=554065 RepID=E1ZJD4_CHLVA|nr:hypothetical protein CHLNCDRAFT_135921 [Chlorella variabilis]EFN53976.1 hypothetical protein CHLNCDRAFT_135921 [Chlorella variabilis]|eukprot:XP_005846078.1 hypothetical protein CHLNCDRAFT_135921 [Chlorella variabilis]
MAAPLFAAAEAGDEAEVRRLLAAGALAYGRSERGGLPLHPASLHGHEGVVRLLLDAAPSTAVAAARPAEAPLYFAALGGMAHLVQPLLELATAAAPRAGSKGQTALHVAARTRQAGPVRLLLESNPNKASVADRRGWTPLHTAAYYCQDAACEVVGLLLAAAPATALAVDRDGWTPLHHAADRGNLEAMKLLLAAAPQAAAAMDSNSQAPIHRAADASHAAAVQLLLEAAPELAFAPDAAGGDTPLHLILRSWYIAQRGVEAARCLVRAAPAVQPALDLCVDAWPHSAILFADLAACLPLSQEHWRSIPEPCPDLARALPAVLQRSAAEAGWLVGRLNASQQARLRAAALSLARAQRQSSTVLAAELSGRILALALAEPIQAA